MKKTKVQFIVRGKVYNDDTPIKQIIKDRRRGDRRTGRSRVVEVRI